MREQQVADVVEREAVLGEPGLERRPRRGRPAVEECKAIVGFDEVDTNRAFASPEQEVDRLQRIHNPIFSVESYVERMRWLIPVLAALVLVPAALGSADAGTVTRGDACDRHPLPRTRRLVRPAWLLLPVGYGGKRPLPLVISPHGRGVGAAANMRIWGDLPGEGGFAVINPAGQGRRLHQYSWGYRGQIDDLARMPESSRRTGSGSTGRGSMRSGARWAARRRCSSPHSTRICSPARRRSTPRPTCAALRRLRPHEGRRGVAGAGANRDRRHARAGACAPTPRGALTRSRARLARADIPIQLYWSTQRPDHLATSGSRRSGSPSRSEQDDDEARLWDFYRGVAAHGRDARLEAPAARSGAVRAAAWRNVPPLATLTRARALGA